MIDREVSRTRRVVWRLADDRVVLRPIEGSGTPEPDVLEVAGPAAVVWLALDRPRTFDALRAELQAAGCGDANSELEGAMTVLAEHGLIEESDGG